uniref:Tryptophan 2,3-dioxygenase n=1 Tax=Caulobacter sp. (strain K31) TaxID=366602 RepID=B0T9I9_CAUSK
MTRKRILPQIRSPELELSLVRDIDASTDATRRANVVQTGGEPIVAFAETSNPYIDFHRNDVLHSLQHMRTEAYDEFPFIVMTQVKELIFRSIHYELANIQQRIRDDDLTGALVLAPRLRRCLELLVKTWDVLSTITTQGFNAFRDQLGTSSGQQSYAYRHVEFILGNKSRRLAAAHANNPDVYPAIAEALNSPSLYDDAIALLHRRGFVIPQDRLERDWAEDYAPSPAVAAAWLAVYDTPTPENDLYQLGEMLIEIDDLFSQFRWRHFVSVQRILGLKPGTGGSAGVGWLRAAVDLRFFPELWSIRTEMGA